MAKQVKCNYKMCDNLGIAQNPVKHNGRYYCETCLEKLQKEEEITLREKEKKLALREKEKELQAKKTALRKKIMDTVLEILPLEIPSLINKVVTQWVSLGYSMEYILYTTEYIRLNKCVLNHVHGIRYYMNKDEIKNQYEKRLTDIKYKKMMNKTPTEPIKTEIKIFNNDINTEDSFMDIL